MKLTIEPTKHFFMAGDVMVRMWHGTADNGTDVITLVAGVAFSGDAEAVAKGLELVSIPPPDSEAVGRWAYEILGRMKPPVAEQARKAEQARVARCPSTHCERRGECCSPHECIVKPVATTSSPPDAR